MQSATFEAPQAVDAKVYFLKDDEKFKYEKPYSFKFAGLCHNGPPTNVKFERREISITDVRGQEESFNLKTNGFRIMSVENDLSYDDYHTSSGKQLYFQQLESLLKTYLGASTVKVFRHGIRKRDRSFGAGHGGEPFENDQPTTLAHCDASLDECSREIRIQEGKHSDGVLSRRFQWINVWKPLKGPMNDWPLALCDASSLESKDLQASDLIYPDHAAENAVLCHNSNQRWYYLSNHMPSEAIVFVQSDSQGNVQGVPHCSFANPKAPADEEPRESIEVRLLVYYD